MKKQTRNLVTIERLLLDGTEIPFRKSSCNEEIRNSMILNGYSSIWWKRYLDDSTFMEVDKLGFPALMEVTDKTDPIVINSFNKNEHKIEVITSSESCEVKYLPLYGGDAKLIYLKNKLIGYEYDPSLEIDLCAVRKYSTDITGINESETLSYLDTLSKLYEALDASEWSPSKFKDLSGFSLETRYDYIDFVTFVYAVKNDEKFELAHTTIM